MEAHIRTVSSTAELYEALNAATGGDVIELAAGEYAPMALRQHRDLNVTFDSTVTIRSADPDRPATITGMTVTNAANLTFETLFFDYRYTDGDGFRTQPFKISGSSDITIRNSLFEGDRGFDSDSVVSVEDYPVAAGLAVNSSENVLIENNEITNFARGLTTGRSTGLTIRGNDMHGQRMDMITVGRDTTDLLIEDNYLHDFFAHPGTSDHRDMIQMWTANATIPTSGVTIRNNVMSLGGQDDTPLMTQAIFIQNEAVIRGGAGPEMYYRDVEITGNVILNGQKKGVYITDVDGLTVANNTMLRIDAAVGRDGGAADAPAIIVKPNSLNVTIRDNVTEGIYGHDGQADWSVSGNVLVQDDTPLLPGYYSAHFINAVPGQRWNMVDIQVLEDSVIARTGAGAERLLYDATPDELTALARVDRDTTFWTDFHFDARYSAGPDGPTGGDASYLWDFGDGNSATGVKATHTYARPGSYAVTLTVTDAAGAVSVSSSLVEVIHPEIGWLDPDADTLVFGDDVTAVAMAPAGPEGGGDDREAILFDGAATSHAIAAGSLSDLAGGSDFQLDLTLFGADWDTGGGEVARVRNGFSLKVLDDGAVSFRLSTGEAGAHLVSDLSLPEDAWTNLSIRFDATAGTLGMLIDGEAAGRIDVTGNIGPDIADELVLGSIGPHVTGFTGALAALSLEANTITLAKLAAPAGEPPAPALPAPAFDLQAPGDAETVYLVGDAYLDGETGTFHLDGEDDRITLSETPEACLDGQFTMELEYRRDVADGAYARLAWFHGRFGLEAVEDGLAVRVRAADGKMERIVLKDLGLNDTDWHKIMVGLDEGSDEIRIAVDDELVHAQGDVGMLLTDPGLTHVWNWQIGGAWTGHLDGEIGTFRLYDGSVAEDVPML